MPVCTRVVVVGGGDISWLLLWPLFVSLPVPLSTQPSYSNHLTCIRMLHPPCLFHLKRTDDKCSGNTLVLRQAR